MLQIDPGKVLDTIANRQTQYYSLWGFYTVVQFSAASFSLPAHGAYLVAVAVLCGVWVFNIGHLCFVLACVAHINRLRLTLKAGMVGPNEWQRAVHAATADFPLGSLPWNYWKEPEIRNGFIMNTAVHLSIDLCATAAVLLRAYWGPDPASGPDDPASQPALPA